MPGRLRSEARHPARAWTAIPSVAAVGERSVGVGRQERAPTANVGREDDAAQHDAESAVL